MCHSVAAFFFLQVCLVKISMVFRYVLEPEFNGYVLMCVQKPVNKPLLISNVTQSFWFHVYTTENSRFLRNETDAALLLSINVSLTDEKIREEEQPKVSSVHFCVVPLLPVRQPHHYRPGH